VLFLVRAFNKTFNIVHLYTKDPCLQRKTIKIMIKS